jgi:hypothetical protein
MGVIPDEAIKLNGKDDVFNYELSPHQIETELLCGERLYFQIKFSTAKRDMSLRMIKNGTITKLKQTSMVFQTGRIEKVSQKGADHSKVKRKEEVVKNDLQDKICPSISSNYMDSSNSFFMDQMGLLDNIIKLLNQGYFT